MIEKAMSVAGTMVLPTGVALLHSNYIEYVEMNLVLYGGLCVAGGFIAGCLTRYVASTIVRRYREAMKKAEACE